MASLKLPGKAKPSKALGRDRTRPKLTRAYIAQPNGTRELIASDSFILVRLPVADDVPLGALTAEAVKRIEKGERHEITESGSVRFNGDGTPIEYHAPEQSDMFTEKVPAFNDDGCTVLEIGLNPDLLKNLADALGATNGVKIEVPVQEGRQALRGMRVTALGGTGEGLLMPVRLTV